jgi:hypothetical protein
MSDGMKILKVNVWEKKAGQGLGASLGQLRLLMLTRPAQARASLRGREEHLFTSLPFLHILVCVKQGLAVCEHKSLQQSAIRVSSGEMAGHANRGDYHARFTSACKKPALASIA